MNMPCSNPPIASTELDRCLSLTPEDCAWEELNKMGTAPVEWCAPAWSGWLSHKSYLRNSPRSIRGRRIGQWGTPFFPLIRIYSLFESKFKNQESRTYLSDRRCVNQLALSLGLFNAVPGGFGDE